MTERQGYNTLSFCRYNDRSYTAYLVYTIMKIAYIFDLNDIIKKESLTIPHLDDLHYKGITFENLTIQDVRNAHDEVVLQPRYAGQEIEMHVLIFVIKNDMKVLMNLSRVIDGIQNDHRHFNQESYEIHIVCNFIDEKGFSISQYEDAKVMPCLTNNSVCVYSWLLDKYDYSGDKPIIDIRRSSAIVRLAYMLCYHRNQFSIRQMDNDRHPVYRLFGNSYIIHAKEERDKIISYYYYYKSLQYMLNVPDAKLDKYIKDHVEPFKANKAEMDKKIDTSSNVFLNEINVPIEASIITEKTQNLLIKSSDDDSEYLINASDDKLVFIDELSKNQNWQLEGTEELVKRFRDSVEIEDDQESVTDRFLKELHDNLVVHRRINLNVINNEVSKCRREHVILYKKHIDRYLLDFLNYSNGSYTEMEEILEDSVAEIHRSNINLGISFLDYLGEGTDGSFCDKKVSVGDTNLAIIKKEIDNEEYSRKQKYEEYKKDVDDRYIQTEDDKPSKIKASFSLIDRSISSIKEKIRLLTYQLDHWVDTDAKKKLTARTRSMISAFSGILVASLWLYLCHELDFVNDKIKWKVCGIFCLIGIVVGLVMVLSVVLNRKRAEKNLTEKKNEKEMLIYKCTKEMQHLTSLRYHFILAYHGKKTIDEIIRYVQCKRDDLLDFRTTLFKLMIQYKIAVQERKESQKMDYHSIELADWDVKRILFGTKNDRRTIPYCFAGGGITLSDTFDNYRNNKVRYDTIRFDGFDDSIDDDEVATLEKEIIACRQEDIGKGIEYSALKDMSVLPDIDGIEIDDIHQGQCGDCYFMATLASIANTNPEFIVGKNGLIEALGDDHRFFRVKFYDKDGKRVNVNIDNRFWNKNGTPFYAGFGNNKGAEDNTYDPWVMAVEKAWAKVNEGGYDGIEGVGGDGTERVRRVEYSYAVTGKSAFYCMTKNINDRARLKKMIQKHFNEDKLPITLYSASSSDSFFSNLDENMVSFHAYSLQSCNDDDTFDIFNPWNLYSADSDMKGKHYKNVSIDFIKDNFNVVVFFGIKEADFNSFERELTGNAREHAISKEIENMLKDRLKRVNLNICGFDDLVTDDVMNNAHVFSSYLYSRNNLIDPRGINSDSKQLIYVESNEVCVDVKSKLSNYLDENSNCSIRPLNCVYDDVEAITIFQLSPQYISSNFVDSK